MKTIPIYLMQEPSVPGYNLPGLYAPGEPCHYFEYWRKERDRAEAVRLKLFTHKE